jgi:protein SCO1/2
LQKLAGPAAAALILGLLLTGIVAAVPALSRGGREDDIGHGGHEFHPDVRGKPSFVLTDTSGRRFDFQEATRGYAVLLYFGYSTCPDLCPTEMATISAALRQLPAAERERVKVLFVTVDPARDDPASLRAWLDLFDASAVGLTGTEAEIEAAGRAAFGSSWSTPQKLNYEGGYAMSHPSLVLGYSPGGEGPFVFTHDMTVADLSRDIARMVKRG